MGAQEAALEISFSFHWRVRRLTPPPIITERLVEWFRISGRDPGSRRFYLASVTPIDADGGEDTPLFSIDDRRVHSESIGLCFAADMVADHDGRPAVWKVLVEAERETFGQGYVMQCIACMMVCDRLEGEDSPVFDAVLEMYDIFDGKSFRLNDLTENPNRYVYSGDIEMWKRVIQYLGERGAYFDVVPASGTREALYVWSSRFREEMSVRLEARRERLLSLPAMTADELVRSMDDDRLLMIRQLGEFITPESKPNLRLSRSTVNALTSDIEEFIGKLAAAGILVAGSLQSSGMLGRTWRLDPARHKEALSAIQMLVEERARKESAEPQHTVDTSIEARLEEAVANARTRLERHLEVLAQGDKLIPEAEDQVFDLEERLAAAKRRLQTLCCEHGDEDPELHTSIRERLQADVARSESERTAFREAAQRAAMSDVETLAQRAASMGMSADQYLEIVHSLIQGRRPS